MAWKDRLLQASFRDVPFFTTTISNDGGRRLVSHQFPENDNVYHEDLGLRNTEFSFDGYVLGENYFTQRNDLERALNAKGAGRLVHPSKGTMEVVVATYTVSETITDGRMARFSITFRIQGDPQLTVENVDTETDAVAKKKTLLKSIKDALAKTYNLSQAPINLINRAIATVDAGLSVVQDLKKIAGTVSTFNQQINTVLGRVQQVALDVEDLGSTFTNLIDFGTDRTNQDLEPSDDTAKAMFMESLGIITSSQTSLPSSDPSFQVVALQRKSAIASAGALLAFMPLNTAEEAEEFRDMWLNHVDVELESGNLTDEEFQAMKDLVAVVQQNIQERATTLSRVVEFNFKESKPSLFITNYVDGNSEREEQIIKGNKVEHPGFISGANPVKVLADG